MMQCAQCKQESTVMFAMKPGRDKLEWYLCAKCWPSGAVVVIDPGRKERRR